MKSANLPEQTKISDRYRIGQDANGAKWIFCLVCKMKSYHPVDVERKYCARCHAFHEDAR